MTIDLRCQEVTRYIQPLREGGSLPLLAEANDDFDNTFDRLFAEFVD